MISQFYLSLIFIYIVILIPFQSYPSLAISAYTFLALIFILPIIGAIIEAGPYSPPNTFTLTIEFKGKLFL
jgi:hypothetical protein